MAGGVVGALLFGYLTDRWGRRRLFMITLGVYLVATVATAFSWGAASFFVFRFLAGMGIGGEYSAINSAIDELIRARVRGWVDLAVNGSWWLGTAAGALLSLLFLDPGFPVDLGWRLTFGLGAVLGVGVLLTRRLVPESPRWLMIKGRKREAEAIVADVERQVSDETGEHLDPVDETIEIEPPETTGFLTIGRVMFAGYRGRTFLGLTMMSAQAFAYNAVFFTYVMLDGEVEAIERAARDAGEPLGERELLRRANARHWGPTVARRALRLALAEGRIARRGNRYVVRTVPA